MSDERREPSYPCPCCGYLVFDELPGSYDICPICFWEDDEVQLADPMFGGGANHPSLADAQRNFVALGACEERLRQFVRPPNASDLRDPFWRQYDPMTDAPYDLHARRDDETALYYWRRQS